MVIVKDLLTALPYCEIAMTKSTIWHYDVMRSYWGCSFLGWIFAWSFGPSENSSVCRRGSPLTHQPWAQLTEESYFGLSWLPLPLLSLSITQTPGSSMTRGLCLDLAGWLFLPAEETSVGTLTRTHARTHTRARAQTHTHSHWLKMCVLLSFWDRHFCISWQQKGQILWI